MKSICKKIIIYVLVVLSFHTSIYSFGYLGNNTGSFISCLSSNKPLATNSAPTLNFISVASKYVDLASGKISCVLNNPTDPVIINGLDINVNDEDLSTLTFTMTSSKTSVVTNTNFSVTGSGYTRKFKINPIGVGYSTITLKVTDALGLSKSLSFSLAVSASLSTAALKDVYNTGVADASTGIAIDSEYMFVADDESNVIKLYNRNNSGLSLYQFDVTSYLGLNDIEVDMEASFRSPTKPNRIYWIGSLSNSKSGNLRPDRNRIFATDIVGTGANATLVFVGYSDKLRSSIISWGDSKGYNFTNKAKEGVEPKRVDGFNVEGLEIGPDNTTLYIGFRAPYVGVGNNKAVICPLLNFETWFGNGNPSASPSFGSPIELNLNNHGIRSLGKNESNQYLIVAGSYASTGTFELYYWNGISTSIPVLLNVDLSNLKPEGIVEVPSNIVGNFTLDLISDLGSSVIYNDGLENKDVVEANHRKFLTSTLRVTSALVVEGFHKEKVFFNPNPVSTILNLTFESNEVSKKRVCRIFNSLGGLAKEVTIDIVGGNATVDFSSLPYGVYFVQLPELNKSFKIIKEGK